MDLTLITPPAEQPVSLAEMRAQIRLDGTDEDSVVSAMLAAAVSYLDGAPGILGRCIIDQVWRLRASGWSNGPAMPFPDVSAVTITYVDAAGNSQVVDSAQYSIVVDEVRPRIVFAPRFDFPALSSDDPRPVSYDLTAGFGLAGNVPEAIKMAIKLLAAHWFEHREAVMAGGAATEMPLAFNALIAPYRMVRL